MIKVSNLNIDYGDNNGIFDINMTIADGEICAVIGHSGCGKTTLLNTLAGLLVIDSGEISITNQQNTNASIGLVQPSPHPGQTCDPTMRGRTTSSRLRAQSLARDYWRMSQGT